MSALAVLKARAAALLGAGAEARAEAYLLKQGLLLVARNWSCHYGELDVVMCDDETLVVVEVRARSTLSYGGALGSITAGKRGRLMRTVQAFQQAHPQWQDAPVRFDVICFEADGQGRWLKDAFDTDTSS
ncbi:MAG: YraN family protein [Pseudomonadota bacterium]